ncbi:MAG: PH domain-containing protein, partial [Pirellula sp.]
MNGKHLHPLSLGFELARMIRANVIPTIAALLSAGNGGQVGMYVGLAIFAVALTIAIIRYFTFRYQIGDDELIIRQGLLGRLHRTIPVGRIQNIDLSQNVFHRLLHVAEVRIETGSGTEPEAIMRVVSLSEYDRLKHELLDRKPDAPRKTTSENLPSSAIANLPAGELILALPSSTIAVAGFMSNRGEVIAGVIVGLLWQWRVGEGWMPWQRWSGGADSSKESFKAMANDGSFIRRMVESVRENYGVAGSLAMLALLIIAVFALLRTFSAIWYVLKFYGYRLEKNDNSLHVRCGLFTKISATIPLGRIQFVSVHRGWLARRIGLASIRIETAGGGSEKAENAAGSVGRKWFVPVVSNADVPRILRSIDSRIELDNNLEWQQLSRKAARRMLRPVLILSMLAFAAGLYWRPFWGWSIALPLGLVGSYLAVKKSKSRRYARTDWGVVYRSGLIKHKCSMTFMDKIQSVHLSQTPFDRRWGMASLAVDTSAAGPADHRIQVEYLDVDSAHTELSNIQS